MSFIDIEENENEVIQMLSKSEVDIPRSKLSSNFHEEIKGVASDNLKFTTVLQPTFSQIDLNNHPKTSKHMYKEGLFRSISLSKLSLIPNSPLVCFKKSAHINNIKSVNKLSTISPLLSKCSGNCKPKLSTRINILKLNANPNKRKLTSNQITDVLKPKLLGDTVRQCKNNFATQIIKQTIREVDEENNLNEISSNISNDKENDNKSQNQYVINIIQPQSSSAIEFESIKKQIKQTAKCAYTKTFSVFCGFVAFTFKTNEETFLDKVDIVLNKELHHNSTPNDLCHCFGVFPCFDNEHISSMLKERFHKHLLHKKDIAFNPVNAFFDTFIHFNKKITNDHNHNHTTTPPTLLSLLIMNNHIYIANNSLSKCLCFNIDNMSIHSLTKTQVHSTLNAVKDDFAEKKQQFQYNTNSNKSLSQTITLKTMSFHSPHNANEPIVTELSLNNLQQQDTIDFIVVVNENIASVLTNKEIILAILTSLLSNTLSYERTLETVIDSICIEAARKNAKFPLSVVFLPMKGYYSLVSGNQKETYVNNILQKLKNQVVNEDALHSQCVVYRDNRNGKKTSAITVHNHVRCKLSTNDVGVFKDHDDVTSSFNSSYSKSRSWASSGYKEGVRCKKVKRFFCGCFA